MEKGIVQEQAEAQSQPKWLHRSKWYEGTGLNQKVFSQTYIKPPVEGEVKGKLARKWAKKQRMKKLKEAQR